ncbi:MAG: DUF4263 domain-containing protein [Microbacteriaceae bacterium]|nr:DUF4263 domain-containing protein [Microbacteriaceae bacterium]
MSPFGTVKWFNPEKGFGFITPDDGSQDLFCHYSAIEGSGYRSLEEGQRTQYEVVAGQKGPQAAAIRVSDFVEEASPPEVQDDLAATVAIAWMEGRLRAISVSETGQISLLEGFKGLHHLLYIADARAALLQEQIEEFEELINDREVKETAIQEFLERNPDFLTGDEYRRVHGRIVLEREEGGPLIPDFVLEPIHKGGLADLAELKLPSARLLIEKKNRIRMSSSIFEACAQLRTYSDYFESAERRMSIEDRYGLSIFRPNLYVVIGRRGEHSQVDFRAAERDLAGVRIRTYDDLLDRARKRMGRP